MEMKDSVGPVRYRDRYDYTAVDVAFGVRVDRCNGVVEGRPPRGEIFPCLRCLAVGTHKGSEYIVCVDFRTPSLVSSLLLRKDLRLEDGGSRRKDRKRGTDPGLLYRNRK